MWLKSNPLLLTNRFEELVDLIECLRTMDRGSWHCKGESDQDHPQENLSKKTKWFSEEALQIAEKRRKVKGKGEKERYTHLNAEFQRIPRRGKKAFLSGQCKEIKENNRMGKTRDLFKKIKDTKGIFHAKMGSINDRNCIDLRVADTEVWDLGQVRLHLKQSIGEGNGTPLQYFCLENPMDGGAC